MHSGKIPGRWEKEQPVIEIKRKLSGKIFSEDMKAAMDGSDDTLFEQTCAETRLGMSQINPFDASDVKTREGADPSREILRSQSSNPHVSMHSG